MTSSWVWGCRQHRLETGLADLAGLCVLIIKQRLGNEPDFLGGTGEHDLPAVGFGRSGSREFRLVNLSRLQQAPPRAVALATNRREARTQLPDLVRQPRGQLR